MRNFRFIFRGLASDFLNLFFSERGGGWNGVISAGPRFSTDLG